MSKNKKHQSKKKRKKITAFGAVLFLALIVLIGLLIYFLYFKIEDNKKLPTGPIIAEDKTPKIEEDKLSMVMVGDYLIHTSIYNEANKNANYDGYDFKPMISLIKDYIATNNYDLAYYNQETIIGGSEIGLSSYPAFNSPYEAADAMIDAGFNMVSLATNHTLDRGEKAINNSCNYWNSKEDILTAGSYCSNEERLEDRIFTKNNITYTMLSYTYGTNGIPIPKDKEYYVNVWPTAYYSDVNNDSKYQAYKEVVKEDILRLRDKVDVLFVAMHWGDEYNHTPSNYQKDMANFLAEQGVDVVIGTHPHVVQPIDYIDDTLVIYSLGNFISAQTNENNYARLIGLMSSLDIIKTTNHENDTVDIKIDNLNNELIYTYYDNFKQFKVIPFSQMSTDYNSNYLNLYEKYVNVIKQYDEQLPVVEAS